MKIKLYLRPILISLGIMGLALGFLLQFYPQPQSKWVSIDVHHLPGWNTMNHAQSLQTLQQSCRLMLKQAPDRPIRIGEDRLRMKAWFPICQTALNQKPEQAQAFFEHHFQIKTWKNIKSGLVTGYYSPSYPGRLQADAHFRYPVYAKPHDLITLRLEDFIPNSSKKILYGKIKNQQFIPYDSRNEINQGSLNGRAQVLAWLANPMDALDLEIQGAGSIETPEKTLVLNYAAQNGHPYQALGHILIEAGLMERKKVTMNSIRAFFNQHPEQVASLFAQNPSFVFFKQVSAFQFLGAQNINLNPGYSIAIDPKYVALGTPVFIATTLPNQKPWQRLLIAQDTGGAIKGKMRADIYWGRGKKAKQLASDMKQSGKFWYFVPKT